MKYFAASCNGILALAAGQLAFAQGGINPNQIHFGALGTCGPGSPGFYSPGKGGCSVPGVTSRVAYVSGATYAQGVAVIDSSGNAWTSLVNSNVAAPSTAGDTANWRLDLRAPTSSGSGAGLPPATAAVQMPLYQTSGSSTVTPVSTLPASLLVNAPTVYPLASFYGAVSGTDATAAIKAALAANPNGTVSLGAGSFTISSTISMNVTQSLQGAGNGATALNCTMTSTPCFVYSGPSTSIYTTPSIRELSLNGPGSGTASIGVFLGGDPNGTFSPSGNYANGASLTNVLIQNFGTGVQWGNNAWLNFLEGDWLIANGTGLNMPATANSGEAITLKNTTIANGNIPISDTGGMEIFWTGGASDYNSSPITTTNGYLYFTGVHFEQNAGAFVAVPYGTPNISLQQCNFILQNASGTDKDFIDVYPQKLDLTLIGGNFFSNHTVTGIISGGGSNTTYGRIENVSGNTDKILNVVDPAFNAPNLVADGFGVPKVGGASLPASTAANQVPQYTAAGSSTVTPVSLAPSAFTDTTQIANVKGILPVAQLPTIPSTQVSNSDGSPVASQTYVTQHAGTPTAAGITSALGAAPVLANSRATYAAGTYSQGARVTDGNGNGWTSLVNSNTAAPSATGDTASWLLDLRAPGSVSVAGTATSYRLPLQANKAGVLGADNFTGYVPSTVARGGVTQIEAPMAAFKGPRVNVLNSDFAGGADPTGATSSDAAFQAAIAYAGSIASSSITAPEVYFPRGHYKFSQSLIAASGGYGMSFDGDGENETILEDTSATATAMIFPTYGTSTVAYGHRHVRNLTILEQGHTSKANLLENLGVFKLDVENVHLANTGGICYALYNNAERNETHNLTMANCGRPMNFEGNVNESYFYNTHIDAPGFDAGGYIYGNRNAVNGAIPTGTAAAPTVIYPDYNAAITALSGQNIHFIGGSVKALTQMGCLHFIHTNGFSAEKMYCEGFGYPSVNPTIQVEGASPLSGIAAALSSTATTATASNGIYQPLYVGEASSAISLLGWGYQIQPLDYLRGSTAASAICSGVSNCTITRGTVEYVLVQAFYGSDTSGNTTVLFGARGQIGPYGAPSTAQNWPGGTVLSIAHTGGSDGATRSMHLNGSLGLNTNTQALGCSAPGQPGYTMPTSIAALGSSTSNVCSEAIIGTLPSGYDALTPGQGYSPAGNTSPSTLSMNQDDTYLDTNSAAGNTAKAVFGEGVSTIPLNGNLTQNYSCLPVQGNTQNPATALSSYYNGYCVVNFGQYPNDTGGATYAQANYADDSGTRIETVNKTFTQNFAQYNTNVAGVSGINFNGAYQLRDYASGATLGFNSADYGDPTLFFNNPTGNVFVANSAGLSTNKPFIPNAGINYPQTAYLGASSTIPPNIPIVNTYQPSGGATFVLPVPVAGQRLTVYSPSGNPFVLQAPLLYATNQAGTGYKVNDSITGAGATVKVATVNASGGVTSITPTFGSTGTAGFNNTTTTTGTGTGYTLDIRQPAIVVNNVGAPSSGYSGTGVAELNFHIDPNGNYVAVSQPGSGSASSGSTAGYASLTSTQTQAFAAPVTAPSFTSAPGTTGAVNLTYVSGTPATSPGANTLQLAPGDNTAALTLKFSPVLGTGVMTGTYSGATEQQSYTPFVGTDAGVLTAGTVSATAGLQLCTDAKGGATTTCSSTTGTASAVAASVTVGAGAGSGATATTPATSTNVSGTIALTVPNGVSTTAGTNSTPSLLATLSWQLAGDTRKVCQVAAHDLTTLSVRGDLYFGLVSGTSPNFTTQLFNGPTALPAGPYSIDYVCQ